MHVTRAQISYNYRLSRAHIVVENAFGRLKARWLLKPNDILIENVPHLVAACCVLHNIRGIHREAFDDDGGISSTAATTKPTCSNP